MQNEMGQSLLEIKNYYDAQVTYKLRNFVESNQRVERAWKTLTLWGPKDPGRILEIGCGIGAVCWRMSKLWPKAEVVGLDISDQSLIIAEKMFGAPNVSFCRGPLVPGLMKGRFDLMLLMDVYEHIAVEERPTLHQALLDLQSECGRIFLSFPTPRHLAWLRQHHPQSIQPVDEDISIDSIITLARDTGNEVLHYQEVGVWQQGDYAHAVLGKNKLEPLTHPKSGINSLLPRVYLKLFAQKLRSFSWGRLRRLAMVRYRLGTQFYPGKWL